MNFLFTHTPLKFFVQDFWRDEAFSYMLARRHIIDILLLSGRDFSPPLYYILLHYWALLFGRTEVALRSLSLVFFVLMIYVCEHILLEVFKLPFRKRLPVLLFILINPILLYYAFEARGYSMFAFLATLSTYAFLTKKKKLYIISTIAGLYTHYFMIFLVLAQAVYIWLTCKKHERIQKLKLVALPSYAFLPWLLITIAQKLTSNTSFWIEKVHLSDILYLPGVLYTGYEKDFHFPNSNSLGYPSVILIISVVIILIVTRAYLQLKHQHTEIRNIFIYLLLWTGLPSLLIFFISFIKPLYLPRYLIFTTPGVILLLIFSLRFIPYRIAMTLFSLLTVMTFWYQTIQIDHRTKENISSTYRKINNLAKSGDVIYVTSELDYFTAQYYFDPNRVYIYGRNYASIPQYVGKSLIPKEKVTDKLPSYPQRAFIMSSSTNFEIQTMY